MAGETDLKKLLASMSPSLMDSEYVFLSFENANYSDHANLAPIASFIESEGLTLVVPKVTADDKGLVYQSVLRGITLKVHSSLDAVGLTAAFTQKLAEQNISANVIAGYFHDTIFVPSKDADKAMAALKELSNQSSPLPANQTRG